MNYLYNVPSIGLWTIFNEGWGQFDSKAIYEELQKLDNTRLFDHASGWHDQNISDMKSYHVYFKHFKIKKPDERAIILSEFGGYVFPIEGHQMKGNHVYKAFKSKEDWIKQYKETIKQDKVTDIYMAAKTTDGNVMVGWAGNGDIATKQELIGHLQIDVINQVIFENYVNK